eukprot:9073-Prorocentrum_minimum.AAC.1
MRASKDAATKTATTNPSDHEWSGRQAPSRSCVRRAIRRRSCQSLIRLSAGPHLPAPPRGPPSARAPPPLPRALPAPPPPPPSAPPPAHAIAPLCSPAPPPAPPSPRPARPPARAPPPPACCSLPSCAASTRGFRAHEGRGRSRGNRLERAQFAPVWPVRRSEQKGLSEGPLGRALRALRAAASRESQGGSPSATSRRAHGTQARPQQRRRQQRRQQTPHVCKPTDRGTSLRTLRAGGRTVA